MRISDWSSDVCSSDLALPTEDAAAALDLFPAHVEGPAAVADPLRPPLPAAAGLAALDHEDAFLQAVPVGGAEAVGRSEEHTSELQSLMRNSYAVFCLKKKNIVNTH